MPRSPYIGVTGAVTLADANGLRGALKSARIPEGWRAMVGILVSHKTLQREAVANRRYPALDQVEAIAERLADVAFVTIHYNTREHDTLDKQLARVRRHAPSAHGFQINMRRPAPDLVARFRERHPDQEIILQVNRSSLSGRTADGVAEYVGAYAPWIDHALLDLSGGTGEALDEEWMRACLTQNAGLWKETGVVPGVAGGLSGTSAGMVAALARAAAEVGVRFSTDAEGRLRIPVADPIAGERFQDRLDAEAARIYLDLVGLAIRKGTRANARAGGVSES